METYFKFKHLTRKTDNMINYITKPVACKYKNDELKLKETLDLARKIKLLLKKLDKIWERNKKALEKGLLTENDCTKEEALAKEIDKNIELYHQKLSTLPTLKSNETGKSAVILKFSRIFDRCRHRVDYNSQ